MKLRLMLSLVLMGWFSWASAVELTGYLLQGGWVQVKTEPTSELIFADRRIKTDSNGLALIAFPRDASPDQTLILVRNGEQQKFNFKIEQREYPVQRINGLAKKYVSPGPETLAKIKLDRKKAVDARKIDVRTPYFLQGFDWPTEGWITGIYGSQRILNGQARAPHMGVDIAADTGTAIYAPASGEVTLSESMELSGNTLFVDHGYGLRSDFMHLDEIHVKQGELVEKGQLIARMGATGRATGPHLHWGMSWFNVRVDPSLVLNLERPLVKGVQVLNGQVKYED